MVRRGFWDSCEKFQVNPCGVEVQKPLLIGGDGMGCG